ncbi:hypothetical protein DZK25_11040 [Wenzhouxiangella sp. 15181]|nr:hypothetical protein DZK25_11040 [Wenzhouxiangella sp. 15181]RFP68455.1 hypothetical protein DZK26_07145 [Wenzhouxiangella sp. 15190]
MKLIYVFIFLVAPLVLASCTTTQKINRPDGRVEYLIACGASTGWGICYREANETCPDGYETVSEKAGLNRKELRIACPE